tara:strand:- start:902 stop:1162 length:261 start_codon:yes stop_codon:yes gene_type:complete
MNNDMLDFIKFKKSQFEELKTNIDKSIVFGQLKALENLALYIDNMRESLTRLLVINGIEDEEDFDKKIANPPPIPKPPYEHRSASP